MARVCRGKNWKSGLEPYFEQQNYPGAIPLSYYLHAAHPREILVRMLRNLKTLFVEHMRWERVLGVQAAAGHPAAG